jgi:hypothetical protein
MQKESVVSGEEGLEVHTFFVFLVLYIPIFLRKGSYISEVCPIFFGPKFTWRPVSLISVLVEILNMNLALFEWANELLYSNLDKPRFEWNTFFCIESVQTFRGRLPLYKEKLGWSTVLSSELVQLRYRFKADTPRFRFSFCAKKGTGSRRNFKLKKNFGFFFSVLMPLSACVTWFIIIITCIIIFWGVTVFGKHNMKANNLIRICNLLWDHSDRTLWVRFPIQT